ncbi:MAG: EscV/YscV/HrcV family type III secretion system export apparatus protein, partial [Bdellovibrio sp.]
SRNDENMGSEMVSQLLLKPRAVAIASGIIGVLALIPGLPTFPFLVMSAILGFIAWLIARYQKEEKETERKKAEEIAAGPKKENIESLLPLDMIELEVGYGLINVVESDQSGDLLERISSIRKQFALDLGIVVPSVHIRDNLQLESGEYRVLIKGNKVGGGTLRSDALLAMDPGNVNERIDGVPTKEPAFGLDALWISPGSKEQAEMAGYTVVDLATVMATHLTEIIRSHAHELLGRQEASSLIENFKKTHPKVVEDLIPDHLSLGNVVRVLQSLLREQVSIRDLRTIFETLADEASRSKDVEVLNEAVRKALARAISAKYLHGDTISVMTLDPRVEELVSNNLLQTELGVQLVMDPGTAQSLINKIASTVEAHPEIASQPILLTSPTTRRHLHKLTSRFIPQLIVLSHSEVSAEANVRSVGSVELSHAS